MGRHQLVGAGSGISGADANVDAFAFDQTGNVYVGGSFTSAGGQPASSIARWNGIAWSTLGTGMGGSSTNVAALAMDANGRSMPAASSPPRAACRPTTSRLGRQRLVRFGLGNELLRLYPGLRRRAELYTGGGFTTAGGNPASNIARWDGANWSALGSGANNTVFSIALDGAGRLYAGGAFTAVAGTNVSAYLAQANVLPMLSKLRRNSDGSMTFDLLTTPIRAAVCSPRPISRRP